MPEDEKAKSSTAQTDATAGDKADSEGPVPRARFKEVTDQLAQYRDFGTPEELNEALTELVYAKQRIAELEEKPKPTKAESKEVEDRKAEIARLRKELAEIAPEIPDAYTEVQAMRAARAEIAWETTVDLMKQHGLGEKREDVTEMSTALAELLRSDAGLHRRYLVNPAKAVEQAFERMTTKFGEIGRRKAAAEAAKAREATKGLPRVHGGGGTGGGEPPKEAASLKEAQARARERMAATG